MFRRLLVSLAAIAAWCLLLAAPASAQQRIAFVIGNAAYPKGPIAHSLADGGLVAEALTSIGFEIVEGADVNSGDFRRLFGEFLAKVNAAGPDAIAFIYYTGYAVQFEGDNYLIPVDAQLNRDSEIPIQGVRLFDLLRPLADAPASAKIVILDATRALPFQIEGGGIAPGLGAIEAAPNLLVAFSSAPGTIAPDGQGPYGAYAMAIAEMVREPGLDIDTMFARIRLRTNETTQGAQTPWEVSQLQQVAMLVPGQAAPPPAGAPQGLIQAPQDSNRRARGAPPCRRRVRFRRSGRKMPTLTRSRSTICRPTSNMCAPMRTAPIHPRVWAMIRARREALLWREALLVNSPDAYWTYLERYPDGLYVFDARRRLRRLAAAERPPGGWRMMEFAHVPPPLAGEPARIHAAASAGSAAAPLSRAAARVHRRAATSRGGRPRARAQAAAHVPGHRDAASWTTPRLPGPSSGRWRGDAARGASRHAPRMEGTAARPSQGGQPAACGRASGIRRRASGARRRASQRS